jgi:hypothetical protein
MVDEDARDRAIYQALKAVDEVAAALQTHLIEEHQADPERSSAQSTSTNSLKLLRQARERGGEQADRGGGKPDLAEEQLLDRHPEVDAQQPRRDIQRAKAPADSGA